MTALAHMGMLPNWSPQRPVSPWIHNHCGNFSPIQIQPDPALLLIRNQSLGLPGITHFASEASRFVYPNGPNFEGTGSPPWNEKAIERAAPSVNVSSQPNYSRGPTMQPVPQPRVPQTRYPPPPAVFPHYFYDQDKRTKGNKGPKRRVNVEFTVRTKRDPKATGAVLEYAKRWTGPKKIKEIWIKNAPLSEGGKAWHAGGTNGRAPEHVTAQLYDEDRKLITTVHIDKDGKIC